ATHGGQLWLVKVSRGRLRLAGVAGGAGERVGAELGYAHVVQRVAALAVVADAVAGAGARASAGVAGLAGGAVGGDGAARGAALVPAPLLVGAEGAEVARLDDAAPAYAELDADAVAVGGAGGGLRASGNAHGEGAADEVRRDDARGAEAELDRRRLT